MINEELACRSHRITRHTRTGTHVHQAYTTGSRRRFDDVKRYTVSINLERSRGEIVPKFNQKKKKKKKQRLGRSFLSFPRVIARRYRSLDALSDVKIRSKINERKTEEEEKRKNKVKFTKFKERSQRCSIGVSRSFVRERRGSIEGR